MADKLSTKLKTEKTIYTEDGLRDLLRVYQRFHRPMDVAKDMGVSRSFVFQFLHGIVGPGRVIPDYFGLRREGRVFVSDIEGVI